ncbi:MAG: SIMPL domain-containing protein [Lysobacter sp.]
MYLTSSASRLRPLALAAALVLGVTAMPGIAQTAPTAMASANTLLSVSAEAQATRVPDIARLSTGVVTQAADAQAAMQANANQMTQVVAAIRKAGIAERDIQTSGVNLNPQYRYADNQSPAITGYEARNNVNITVRKIGELGRIMDALVGVGANQIQGPSFEVDDKESAFDEARRTAIDKAKARASMYATELDLKVLRIVSISEGNGGFGPPMPMMAMARMEKSQADTPIAAGESTLSVSLDVVFELGR